MNTLTILKQSVAGFPPIMRITAGDIINDTLDPEKGVDIPGQIAGQDRKSGS